MFVKVAITVDGKEDQNNLPDRKDESGQYYDVDVTCTSSNGTEGEKPVTGTWDYNAWNLKLENVTSGTKCKLDFKAELTAAEYKDRLDAGIALRRNTYRGKDLSSYFENDTNKKKFYDSIHDGTFDDIYVGDYIESPSGQKYNGTGTDETVRWLIADIDNYLHTGDGGGLQRHHLTIIPAKPLDNKPMNSSNVTTCGYAGSDMVGILDKSSNCTDKSATGQGTLDTILKEKIIPDFGDEHVIEYSNLLTNAVDATATNNRMGNSEVKGASSGWQWYPRKLDLMSEMNVYGGIVASSSVYDTGIDNRQYAIFRLKPELINSYNGQQFSNHYWLKDVASQTNFAYVAHVGDSGIGDASISRGVRPRFLIGWSSL